MRRCSSRCSFRVVNTGTTSSIWRFSSLRLAVFVLIALLGSTNPRLRIDQR